jgi:fatty acid desaturase
MEGVDLPRLKEAHRPGWKGVGNWLVLFLAFLLGECLLALAVHAGSWLLAVPLVVLVAHLMHGNLIVFHESAHGSLCPRRFVNDAIGSFLGSLAFMSLTLFRAVHHLHHAYLATERDEELWPFTQPGHPRWFRRLAAACELSLALAYTPLLFLRAFLRPDSRISNPAMRRRIRLEFAAMIPFWVVLLTAVSLTGTWTYFLVLYVAPAALAGNFQSLRKYIEHMGMTGSTVRGTTRSVVASGLGGRLLSFTLFNEPYHGVHHYFGQLPHYHLPEFTCVLDPAGTDESPPYPSYLHAFRDLVRHLGDPRVGMQWEVERVDVRKKPPSVEASAQGT